MSICLCKINTRSLCPIRMTQMLSKLTIDIFGDSYLVAFCIKLTILHQTDMLKHNNDEDFTLMFMEIG